MGPSGKEEAVSAAAHIQSCEREIQNSGHRHERGKSAIDLAALVLLFLSLSVCVTLHMCVY